MFIGLGNEEIMLYFTLQAAMAIESEQFYTRFKDRISAEVQRRGETQASWDDVLLVAADDYETRAILKEHEISTSGVRRDILYTLHFGRPSVNGAVSETSSFKDIYAEAVSSLRQDITSFRDSQEFLSQPENQDITQRFMGFLNTYLEDKGVIVSDPQTLELGEIKILAESLSGFAEQFTPTFNATHLADIPEEKRPTVIEANRQFTADVLEQLGTFVLEKGKVIATKDQALLVLDVREKAENANRREITPYQVVETLQRAADPFVSYVLHRNGLLVPDDYEPPCKMPHALIIEQGLGALEYAEDTREKVVKPVHLLPSLLEDTTVLQVIMELDEEGMISEKDDPDDFIYLFGGKRGRNFIKFHASVRDAISIKTDGEKFRYRVRTSDEIKEFLLEAQEIIKGGDEVFAEARIVGALLEKDDQVRSAMVSAGLTEEQLKKWPEALETLVQRREEAKKLKPKKDDEDGEEKKEEAFKVSDLEFKDLLEEYSTDLTKLAIEGKIDPVIGRNKELYQMMRILLQRGRSNPLLLGEPGVGKTALFYGLAQMIASGRAPKALLGARIYNLDLSAMNSGAMWRGQFEGRLLPIIQGVAERNARGDKPPIILSVDELHAALQAGSAINTPDAGELLKPYLTRGEISIVGATTQRDYAKTIAMDAALDRRFQAIFIDEPGIPETFEILKGLKEQYTGHHELEIEDALLESVVKLSARYLPAQNQPDKAIRLLDSACARAKMLDKSVLDMEDIIETVSVEAKIDPLFLQQGEEEKFLSLRNELPRQVLGQPMATSSVAEALITAKADLQDPRRPLGVFLFLGPTGVGKTETGRALSRLLHGTESNLIRIDMSDYKESAESLKLVGAPPAHVGYGEEGQLTGAVRRQPYSVVVLDEIEKAHPEVLRRFLPVFEEGEIVDGRGHKISFRNTVIIMTSNLGAQGAVAEAESRGLTPFENPEDWNTLTHSIYEAVAKSYLPPEFLNRIDRRIVFDPLSKEVINQLVDVEIEKLSNRVNDRYGLSISISEEVRSLLGDRGYDPEYGARELKRAVVNNLVHPLSSWVLENRLSLTSGSTIVISGLNSQFKAEIAQEEIQG